MSIIYGEEPDKDEAVPLDEMERPSSELIDYLKEIHGEKDSKEYSKEC